MLKRAEKHEDEEDETQEEIEETEPAVRREGGREKAHVNWKEREMTVKRR